MSQVQVNRVTRTYIQHIAAPPHKVFPLLCPVREKDWLEGWDYEMVYSLSGIAERDCIFTTARHGPSKFIWIVTNYDPDHLFISFVNFMPGVRAMKISITLDENLESTTCAHITYTCTALGEPGQHFIAHQFNEGRFQHMMINWENSINHYLATGQMLKKVHG